MPDVENYEDEKEWMGVCVPKMIGEGRDNDQAVAACMSMWKEKKSVELVSFGGEIKALGNGKVGGYLVRFTDAKTPDLTGDYFDADTEITVPDTLPLFYNHGMDATIKKRIIGRASTRRDEIGIWADSQLNMRDEYEQKIYEMAEAGKLGYSSGALSHLVDREPVGKSFHIKTWVIGEASLTPTPAEFRNTVQTIKSLLDAEEPAKEINMDTENKVDVKSEVAEAVKSALAVRDAELKAEADKQAAIKLAEDAGYQKAVEEIKAKGIPAFNKITTPGFSEEKDAVPAFKHWVATGQVNQALIKPDASFMKADWNVTTGASGSFLVPDPLHNQIAAKRDLASWIRQAPVTKFVTPADHLLVPYEDTSMTAFVLTAENGSYDQNEGTVGQKNLILYKYTKEVQMTEEFVNFQGTNFDSWLVDALGRAEAATENTFATSGTGTGQPQGLVGGATASSLTIKTSAQLNPEDLTALIGKLGGGYNVPSECGFVGANASKWYLKNAILAGPFAYAGSQGTPAPDFFGYPFYVSDDVQSYTASSGTVLYFGNLSYFAVVEKPGMLVQRNPYLYMANGVVALFVNIFRGSGILQSEAIYSVAGK